MINDYHTISKEFGIPHHRSKQSRRRRAEQHGNGSFVKHLTPKAQRVLSAPLGFLRADTLIEEALLLLNRLREYGVLR